MRLFPLLRLGFNSLLTVVTTSVAPTLEQIADVAKIIMPLGEIRSVSLAYQQTA